MDILFQYSFFPSYLAIPSYYHFPFLQKEKKNLQDVNGVYVFNVMERELIDRPTAKLIKEFSSIEGKESK